VEFKYFIGAAFPEDVAQAGYRLGRLP
jgi:hypothetical protein